MPLKNCFLVHNVLNTEKLYKFFKINSIRLLQKLLNAFLLKSMGFLQTIYLEHGIIFGIKLYFGSIIHGFLSGIPVFL